MIRSIVTEVNPQEINGRKLEGAQRYRNSVVVKSHYFEENWVVFKIEGKEYTFDAKELNRAINNAIFWKVK